MSPKQKRRGGVMDESVIYINFTRKQLMKLFSHCAKKNKKTTDKD